MLHEILWVLAFPRIRGRMADRAETLAEVWRDDVRSREEEG